uniref:PKZ n=1 Tax=Ctenopharyngodon idella TaxID=7959 RepID=D2Y3U3_CTEID|nr:PKZ [Ctenopharyngodon idella]
MSAETQMERKIIDFLRQNGKSIALTIAKEIGLDKSTVNRHLYNLQRSNQVFNSNEKPPVWDLMEKTNGIKQTVKTPEQKSLTTTAETCEEKHVRDLLKSGGLKACQIAKDLGQPRKTVNKQLYSMMQTGKVKKCEISSLWLLEGEESNESHSQESDHRLGSVAGLSQSFDVITKLGEGGFGCVFKVKHKFDGKIYAVKKVVLTGEADSEVKALARLDHPNIVRYITCWPDSESCTSNQDRNQVSNTSGSSSCGVTFDRAGCEERNDEDDEDDDDDVDVSDVTSRMESLGSTAELASAAGPSGNLDPLNHSRMYLFIQMEFCEGGTLTTWIRVRNRMNKQRIAVEIHKIFYEIVSGVEYIHSNSLIHRDLKPDNILFGMDGKVKIGDFGLVAAQTNHSGGPVERTKRRGTLQYMSPEQENKRNYDEKTDIFPLGLIWFEMLWKLSTGMERAELLKDLRNQRFPEGFCDSYPTENKFIEKMLSFAPEDRPPAKDIKEKLEKFFSLDEDLLSQKTI